MAEVRARTKSRLNFQVFDLFGWAHNFRFVRDLPVVFVLLLSFALLIIFVMYHCLLLLNFESSVETRNMTAFVRGIVELSILIIFYSMFLISYRLAIITSPGSIPDALMWIYDPVQLAKSGDTMSNYLESAEKKRSGNRRHCKWCMKYKPDRCHHCSICQTCVLRMDHHCPWIINCVGWGNHKYFMLSLLYSCICSIFLGITMMESVLKATKAQVPFGHFFLLLFGETLDILISIVSVCFFSFHLWITCHGMTTIEFCEKRFRCNQPYSSSIWNQGIWKNFLAVFGENPFLWALPLDNRDGDGMFFICESTRLLSDVSTSSNISTLRKNCQFDPVLEVDDTTSALSL